MTGRTPAVKLREARSLRDAKASVVPAKRSAILDFIRKNGVLVFFEVSVNFALPYVIYVVTRNGIGDVKALMASSIPPIVWSLAEFLRKRRLDALSILVLAGIVLSLLAFVGGGSVRFLQLRENVVGALIGVVFLGSAAIGRPLIYELARASMRRKPGSDVASFEALNANAHFRRTMTTMTLTWGIGLIAAAAVSCVILFFVSIGQYLVMSPAISYGAMGALGIWTFWYAKRARRIGDARRAAAASAAVGDPH